MIGRVQSVLKVSCALVLPRASLASQAALAPQARFHTSALCFCWSSPRSQYTVHTMRFPIFFEYTRVCALYAQVYKKYA